MGGCSGCQGAGLFVTGVFTADAIVKAIKKRGCDLVVMALHGRSGLSKPIIGRKTQKVLANSTTPVLVMRWFSDNGSRKPYRNPEIINGHYRTHRQHHPHTNRIPESPAAGTEKRKNRNLAALQLPLRFLRAAYARSAAEVGHGFRSVQARDA
jgi:hypothetical protein